MLKKVLFGLLALVLVAGLGLFFWARSVLASDTVRTTLAAQMSSALGQPVTIGGVSATIYPRTSITLTDVGIGKTSEIKVTSLQVGTDFRALLSRRIEHADLHLDGARLTLPLPAFAFGQEETPEPSSDASPAVQLVSIDEVVLSGIEIVSGGRTLKGDIELVPQGTTGVEIRKIALAAGDMSLTAAGTITDLTGPVGTLTLTSGALNLDELLAFADDFASGSGAAAPATGAASSTSAPPPAAKTGMNMTVSLQAEKATMGGLAIDAVSAKAIARDDSIALAPLAFGLFGGKYEGTLTVGLTGPEPTFKWDARVSNIDVAAATAFAGSPNLITGTLAGTVNLEGQGADAARAMKTVRGSTRVDITNGVVRNLGLVRAATSAMSLSTSGLQQAAAERSNSDEPFTRIGGTIAIANATATTNDFVFEAADLSLDAAGSIRLDASTIDMKGRVQLSEALTKQSNAMLASATSDKGRITLPATITGDLAAPSVKIDAGSMAKRALENVAKEQTDKAKEQGKRELNKRLSGFLK